MCVGQHTHAHTQTHTQTAAELLAPLVCHALSHFSPAISAISLAFADATLKFWPRQRHALSLFLSPSLSLSLALSCLGSGDALADKKKKIEENQWRKS